jgi:hypothetical protein
VRRPRGGVGLRRREREPLGEHGAASRKAAPNFGAFTLPFALQSESLRPNPTFARLAGSVVLDITEPCEGATPAI